MIEPLDAWERRTWGGGGKGVMPASRGVEKGYVGCYHARLDLMAYVVADAQTKRIAVETDRGGVVASHRHNVADAEPTCNEASDQMIASKGIRDQGDGSAEIEFVPE